MESDSAFPRHAHGDAIAAASGTRFKPRSCRRLNPWLFSTTVREIHHRRHLLLSSGRPTARF
jgi:hypothetical protein